MPSYLDDTFLGEPADEGPMHIGSASQMIGLGDEPQPVAVPMVRLPGGIVMPRSTALVLLAIAIAIAIYLWKKQKKD